MPSRDLYSSRLLAWQADTSPLAFEVPTGYVAIVRDLDVYSGGGIITDWKLSVNGVATFAAGEFTIESLPQTAQWRGRQVLNAGELLVFQSDNSTDGLVSGYLLLSP